VAVTPPLVLVEWDDHCENDGNVWWALDDAAAAGVARCRSVGWLLHQDADRVVLSTSLVFDGDDIEMVARPFVLVAAAVRKVTPMFTPPGAP
jgi:hypothetical protein